MLINSILPDRDIAELGITLPANVTLPDYSEKRANVTLYLSTLFCLEAGRRDLAAFAWAWAKADLEYRFETYKPEDGEPKNDAPWARGVAKRLLDIVIDFKINTVKPVEPHGKETVNLAHWLHKVAYDRTKSAKNMEDILDAVDADPLTIALLGFVSTRCCAASIISMNTDMASEKMASEPSMAHNLLEVGEQRAAAYVGVAASFTPLVYKVFKDSSVGPGMPSVWSACVRELFDRDGKVTISEPTTGRTPRQLRDLRWRGGRVSDNVAAVRDRIHEQRLVDASENVLSYLAPDGPHNPDNVAALLREAEDSALLKISEWVPVSFFTEVGFSIFREFGTQSVWEAHEAGVPHFDDRFSDNPRFGSSVSDARVWGEKASPLTKAFFLPRNAEDQWTALGRMFGPHAVVWPNCLLEDCGTVTIGTYRAAPFAIPATPSGLCKALIPLLIAKSGESKGVLCVHRPGVVPLIVREFMGYPTWPDFIEVQLHRKLQIEDANEVINLNE